MLDRQSSGENISEPRSNLGELFQRDRRVLSNRVDLSCAITFYEYIFTFKIDVKLDVELYRLLNRFSKDISDAVLQLDIYR